jgi:hypothetical protein
MSVQDLETGLVELGRYLYSEDATARRRSAFKDQWRRGRARERLDRTAAESAA